MFQNMHVFGKPAREPLMKMYRESDIYLFTSSREAWGLPILEAMANKCAVVGFKVGAMAEIATDQNAVVIENFNFSQMEAEVEKLLNDRQRLLLLQDEAYKTALQLRGRHNMHTLKTIWTNWQSISKKDF